MPAAGTPIEGATVLVVDDDATARTWADACLGSSGFTVAEAASGEQALEWLAGQRPDIVLLDVEMPELDGYETCERIRALPGCATLPVVMVTGLDDAASINRAYDCGATDFITKPINWTLIGYRLPYLIRAGATATALDRSGEVMRTAQRMAELGSWVLHADRSTMTWSEELFRRLGHVPGSVEPSLAFMLERVPEEHREALAAAVESAYRASAPRELVHDVTWPDGVRRTVRHVLEGGHVDGQLEVRGIMLDVTEHVVAQHKIHNLAYVDSLTGLPNRARFHELLEREIDRAGRNRHRLVTMFVDLDNFKRINDTLGHSIGDRLLEEVSRRLKLVVRCYDTVLGPHADDAVVARLGGDEFTLLLCDVEQGSDASAVARRVVEALAEPMQLGGHEVCVTPSIGIAVYPDDARDAETLLRSADAAMYHAKRMGKNGYHYFDASMDATMQRRLAIEQELRRAIERGEVSVHYQPQIDLASGRIVAVEALARWTSEKLGTVSPLEFVAVAEETGLIGPVGEWIMERACTDLAAWRARGLDVGRVAVNVSPVQFAQPGFVDGVRAILERTGLPPSSLDIEITESVVVRDVETAVQVLDSLKALGVQVSVDDFGTGYSTLAQMKQLPVDRLKIDQSFVQQITSSPEDAAITSAVISMAYSMSLDVVAEGVETEAQLAFLARRRCKVAQGYHVAHPMPVAEAERFLGTHAGAANVHPLRSDDGPTVLVVDDDPSFRALVRRVLQGAAFQVIEAQSPDDAFVMLARQEVDVIVSDQVMPDMPGTEFLARARSLFPDSVRVLLSGQSERADLESAINDSAVFRFVDKSSVRDQLCPTIEDALRESGAAGPGQRAAAQPA